MTILDFAELREQRRRAEWDRWCAEQDRALAEIRRAVDALTPIVEQLIAEEKLRPRQPRCEVPRCCNTLTTLHPVQGRTSEDASALISLCVGHLRAVRSGRLRVNADEADTLFWQLCDGPDARPRVQIKWPRRRRRRRR